MGGGPETRPQPLDRGPPRDPATPPRCIRVPRRAGAPPCRTHTPVFTAAPLTAAHVCVTPWIHKQTVALLHEGLASEVRRHTCDPTDAKHPEHTRPRRQKADSWLSRAGGRGTERAQPRGWGFFGRDDTVLNQSVVTVSQLCKDVSTRGAVRGTQGACPRSCKAVRCPQRGWGPWSPGPWTWGLKNRKGGFLCLLSVGAEP